MMKTNPLATLKKIAAPELSARWKVLAITAQKWLHEPPPQTEDLPWWVPQRRIAMICSVAFVGLVALGGLLFIRTLDSAYDDPNKYEQVYYLNNIFTARKNAVTIETNIFGEKTDPELEIHAKLLRLHGDHGKVTSLETLTKKYLAISPLEIRSNDPAIRLEKLPRQRHLHEALREMASEDLVRYLPPTSGHGAVYSFDLEMEVMRGKESLGLYEETFHLRGDALIEQSTLILAIIFTGLAALFLVDLSNFVMDVRWGKYFKAMAVEFAQALHYLERLAQLAVDFSDIQPLIGLVVSKVLREALEQLLQQLEKLIFHADEKEVRALYDEAQELLRLIAQHGADTPSNEAEFKLWQQSLQQVIARTDAIHKRLVFLGQRPLRFHGKKSKAFPALSLPQLQEAIALTQATVQNGCANLHTALGAVNHHRKERRRWHLEARAQRVTDILQRLILTLQQEAIRQDIHKLGINYPRDHTPRKNFETENVRAEGKTRVLENEEFLYYEAFSFGVNVSPPGSAEMMWLEISKQSEEYIVGQATANAQLQIPPPPRTTVLARNDKDEETPITYSIEFAPRHPRANKDTLQFSLTLEDLSLPQPEPDPEPWFEELELSKPPKRTTRRKRS